MAGDTAEDPGYLAVGLSTELTPLAVQTAMRKVAEWQVPRISSTPGQSEWFAALYMGLLAAGETLRESRYREVVFQAAEAFHWELGPRKTNPDDQTIGQVYLRLNEAAPDAAHLRPMREEFDELMGTPDDVAKSVWWYCDALFMAPPAWAGLAAQTGDERYLAYMDREWHVTADHLWDTQEHLFVRDATYLGKREKNGRKVLWSRGNGWVMGGLVNVLRVLPPGDRRRAFYVEKLRAMATALARLQGADGLWRSGLLDATDYPTPEVSGSSFYVYAMAWALNNGVLDAEVFRPVVERGWAGLVRQIYADGRLGSVQPGGASPAVFPAGSSWVFGSGAFLLAGSEVNTLASHGHQAVSRTKGSQSENRSVISKKPRPSIDPRKEMV